MSAFELCNRCDCEMPDDGEWFVCPCCRSRTRGLERQQARREAHQAELGMTEQEYAAHCRSLISTEPLDPVVVERAVARMVAEWRPCLLYTSPSPRDS